MLTLERDCIRRLSKNTKDNNGPRVVESAERCYFFLPFFALALPVFPLDSAEDFPAAFSDGALPKTLSHPLTNFLEAPVCTVYPVIVFLSLIQRHESRSLLRVRMQGNAGFVKPPGLLRHNCGDEVSGNSFNRRSTSATS